MVTVLNFIYNTHSRRDISLLECSNCGTHVDESDKFCFRCGKSLINEKKEIEDNVERNKGFCPNCQSKVDEDDKFCVVCGHNIQKGNGDKHTEAIEENITNNIDLTTEAKNLFNHTTKSIGKLAGSEESLNLNLKDMFSEVFKSHSKEESDEIFIAGTKNTTPALNEVSEDWGKPWVFSRVFFAFAITFAALWFLGSVFENENAIPGLIFIGALTVPLTGLFFFYESNAFKNISLFEVLKMFFIGGVFSLISTMFLYNFIIFSDDYYLYGSMTVTDAGLVGLVEETGKAIIIVYFINKYKTNKILNGLLIGGAIGAGFAVFESAGYILQYSLYIETPLINMVFLRAWTALGTHLVWSAIVGAAIIIAKETHNFEFSNIADKRFLFFFFASVILHGIWNNSISLLGSFMFKYIVLIIIAWFLIFILMKAGLKQVNILQKEIYSIKEECESKKHR